MTMTKVMTAADGMSSAREKSVPQGRICPGPICRRECCYLLPKAAIIAQPEVTLIVLRSQYDKVLVAQEIRNSVWLLVRHYCYVRTEAIPLYDHTTFDLGD